jgi:hypothetical protein
MRSSGGSIRLRKSKRMNSNERDKKCLFGGLKIHHLGFDNFRCCIDRFFLGCCCCWGGEGVSFLTSLCKTKASISDGLYCLKIMKYFNLFCFSHVIRLNNCKKLFSLIGLETKRKIFYYYLIPVNKETQNILFKLELHDVLIPIFIYYVNLFVF